MPAQSKKSLEASSPIHATLASFYSHFASTTHSNPASARRSPGGSRSWPAPAAPRLAAAPAPARPRSHARSRPTRRSDCSVPCSRHRASLPRKARGPYRAAAAACPPPSPRPPSAPTVDLSVVERGDASARYYSSGQRGLCGAVGASAQHGRKPRVALADCGGPALTRGAEEAVGEEPIDWEADEGAASSKARLSCQATGSCQAGRSQLLQS